MKTSKIAYYYQGKFKYLEGDKWPEEPNHLDYKHQNEFKEWLWKTDSHKHQYGDDYDRYLKSLTSALKEAIDFEDQDRIFRLIFPDLKAAEKFQVGNDQGMFVSYRIGNQWYCRSLKKGLYNIPEIEVEIVEKPMDDSGIDGSGAPYSKVDFERFARLKESSKSEEETELLNEIHNKIMVQWEKDFGAIHADQQMNAYTVSGFIKSALKA
jgi:hypothetical protein